MSAMSPNGPLVSNSIFDETYLRNIMRTICTPLLVSILDASSIVTFARQDQMLIVALL